MIKRLVCILLSLILLTGAAFALAEETVTEAPAVDAAPTEAPAEDAAPTETPAQEEPVLLATVNGEEIYSTDFYLQNILQYFLGQVDASSEADVELAQQNAMNYTIMIHCLAQQKAAEFGLNQFTDEENAQFEAEWDRVVEMYIPMVNTNITENSTEEEKAAARADAEAYLLENFLVNKDYYIQSQKESVIIERLVRKLNPVTVSDEEVTNYFNDLVADDKEEYGDNAAMYEFYTNYYNMDTYYKPEGYRGITHILLRPKQELMDTLADLNNRWEEQQSEQAAENVTENTEGTEPTAEPTASPEPVTEEMIKAAEAAVIADVQPKIDEIKAKLKDGASFDDLIQEYGEDPGMKDDTRRAEGYPVHADSIIYDPAFTAAAAALEKVGDVSEPIIGSSGVHILHYLRDIPGGPAELTDDIKEELREALQQQLDEEALTIALDQWEAEAVIAYTEAGDPWKMPEQEQAEEPTPEAAPAEEAPAEEAPAEGTPAPEVTPAP